MPAERIAMHNIKELLRLKYDCALSHERIARALSISKGVVAKYEPLAKVALREGFFAAGGKGGGGGRPFLA